MLSKITKIRRIPAKTALERSLWLMNENPSSPNLKKIAALIFLADGLIAKPAVLFSITQIGCSANEKKAQLLDHLHQKLKKLMLEHSNG